MRRRPRPQVITDLAPVELHIPDVVEDRHHDRTVEMLMATARSTPRRCSRPHLRPFLALLVRQAITQRPVRKPEPERGQQLRMVDPRRCK